MADSSSGAVNELRIYSHTRDKDSIKDYYAQVQRLQNQLEEIPTSQRDNLIIKNKQTNCN